MSSAQQVLRFARRWRVADYVCIIVIFIIASVLGSVVRPYCRPFEWNDASISYVNRGNTFPFISVVIPAVAVCFVFAIGEFFFRWKRPAGRLSMGLHLNAWVLTQAYSVLLAFAIVNVAKLYAGRLRPDFIDRLRQEGITAENYDSTKTNICRAAREGRLSFPSGHASTAFSAVTPLCLYLMGVSGVFRGRRLWAMFLSMLPMALPIAVAISRTSDNRHHFSDILGGAIIGSAISVLSVLVSFEVSNTGEWTIREHPVYAQVPVIAIVYEPSEENADGRPPTVSSSTAVNNHLDQRV